MGNGYKSSIWIFQFNSMVPISGMNGVRVVLWGVNTGESRPFSGSRFWSFQSLFKHSCIPEHVRVPDSGGPLASDPVSVPVLKIPQTGVSVLALELCLAHT